MKRCFSLLSLDKGRVSLLYPSSDLGIKRERETLMKVVNSLKTLKTRDRNCRIIRRRGRVYVINKINKRFKARQG